MPDLLLNFHINWKYSTWLNVHGLKNSVTDHKASQTAHQNITHKNLS